MVQVVESLPNKHEALSSNSCIAKKKINQTTIAIYTKDMNLTFLGDVCTPIFIQYDSEQPRYGSPHGWVSG
jgi:hypothetical protein